MNNIFKKFYKNIKDDFSIDPELEFLPAALEIQKTPPQPISRIILWLIIIFFIIAVLWATFGKVDIVAVAQGKIVPTGQVKIIQPLADSIVAKIHVKEGQQVTEGQALIDLDNTQNKATQTSLLNELDNSLKSILRLENLLYALKNNAGVENIRCTPENECILNNITAFERAAIQNQTKSQWIKYNSQKNSLLKQIEEKQAEEQAIKEQIAQLNSTIPLITERANAIAQMLVTQSVSRVEWLNIEEQRIQQVKQLDIAMNNQIMLKAAIQSVEQQLIAYQADIESQWLAEKNELEKQKLNIEQELIKSNNLIGLQTIVSPVDGSVQQLATHTVGGVVTTAQELMRIVPNQDALQIEAMVENKDIGFVDIGQEASIKIDTFPFTKYGFVKGDIQNISNDAIEDERLGLVYEAQLSMQATTMQINNKLVNLSPGMSVTVEVNLGKRRIIEYILTPLLRYKNESIRER